MGRTYRVIDDAWLDEINTETWKFESAIVARGGEIVYEYSGPTYGCISSLGRAVTREPSQTPFFEVAISNLEPIDEGGVNG